MDYKNKEGYTDSTAGRAIHNASKMPKHVLAVIEALRQVASLAGFNIQGRIWLKDKTTGKEFR